MITALCLVICNIVFHILRCLFRRFFGKSSSHCIRSVFIVLCSLTIVSYPGLISAFFIHRIKISQRSISANIIHRHCCRCLYPCIKCSCLNRHTSPAADTDNSNFFRIDIFLYGKKINSRLVIFDINIRRVKISRVAGTFSCKRRIKSDSQKSSFCQFLCIKSGTLLLHRAKRATDRNSRKLARILHRFIKIRSQSNTEMVSKCYFSMIYFITELKNLVPFFREFNRFNFYADILHVPVIHCHRVPLLYCLSFCFRRCFCLHCCLCLPCCLWLCLRLRTACSHRSHHGYTTCNR